VLADYVEIIELVTPDLVPRVVIADPDDDHVIAAAVTATAMRARGLQDWSGLAVIDLRHGELVHWLRFEGAVAGMFDVGVIAQVRCPRGIGVDAAEMAGVVRGEIS